MTYRLAPLPLRGHIAAYHIITACRKEANASVPLLLTNPYRLEGTTLAYRLDASHDCEHPCCSFAAFPFIIMIMIIMIILIIISSSSSSSSGSSTISSGP